LTETTTVNPSRALQRLALAAYIALVVLCVSWEGWLAPSVYAPPLFWLSFKTVPLLLPVVGLFRGTPKTYFLASLLVLVYFIEGVVLAYSHRTEHLTAMGVLPLACTEIGLSLMFFFSAAFYVRRTQNKPVAA